MSSIFLRHLLPHPGELLCHTHAAAFLRHHPYPARRHRRSVLPELFRNIPVIDQCHIFSLKSRFQLFSKKSVCHSAVKADRLAFRHIFFQIFPDRRNIFLMHLIQDDARPLQFALRLHKISAVRPQPRLFFTHHERSRRTGKTRQEFPHFKMIIDVLRIVIVCRRHDVIVDPCLP